MRVATQAEIQIFITFYNGVFKVSAGWDNFAIYDTPAEVIDVIARLKAAILPDPARHCGKAHGYARPSTATADIGAFCGHRQLNRSLKTY